jgi:hypothetical protein
MRSLIGLILAFGIAAVIGLGATYYVLTHAVPFGSLTIGSWTTWPKTGTVNIDPYARASIARTGELPMSSGDGVAFYAWTDDDGRSLEGRCDVILSGVTPQARFWTLTLYDPEGHIVANTIKRYGFTSQEIVRHADGSFEITVAPRARPGNWLPTGGVDTYLLVMRLYDSPVGVATRTGREAPMPAIKRGSCL